MNLHTGKEFLPALHYHLLTYPSMHYSKIKLLKSNKHIFNKEQKHKAVKEQKTLDLHNEKQNAVQ